MEDKLLDDGGVDFGSFGTYSCITSHQRLNVSLVGNGMLVSLTIITEVWLCKTGCSCAEKRWYIKKCKSQGICLAPSCPTEWVTAGTNKTHEVRRKQPSVLDNSKQNVCIHRSLLLHCRPCHPLPLYEWNGETHTRESICVSRHCSAVTRMRS